MPWRWVTPVWYLRWPLAFCWVSNKKSFFSFDWQLLCGLAAAIYHRVPSCRDFSTPTDQTNTKAWREFPLSWDWTEWQQHPLHLKGNFVMFCRLTSCNGWVVVASYPQLFKEERFLGYVFSLEECKPKLASFLTCFFHLETKIKKWESEKTCSVSTEMWDKTLRIT